MLALCEWPLNISNRKTQGGITVETKELEELIVHIQNIKCETNTIELKKAAMGCPQKIYDTLSSFSNQDEGGIILFGVDENDYSVSGVYDPADLEKKVNGKCKEMEPVVRPVMTCALINDKPVVSAEIPGIPYADRPAFYKAKGRIKGSYIRVGDSDEPMTEAEIYSFESYRLRAHDDESVCGSDMKFVDEERLASFIEKSRENRPNFTKHFNDEELLESTGVTKDGKPTLAGILVFSEVPQLYFPDLSVVAYSVPGNELGESGSEGERFTANKRIDGSLNTMLEESLKFIRMNTRNKITINKDGSRKDDGEYPQIAVREAVLNALMHRDYGKYSLGSPVQIAIFHNRMEITSPGSLYGTSSVNKLGKIRLETRNSRLAILLEMTGIAEHRYSGIPTIRKECLAAGLPEPEFINKNGEFTVIFKNRFFDDDIEQSASSPAGSEPELNDLQKEVLAFCSEPRTRNEIAQTMNLTASYLRTAALTPLLKAGLLKMTMPEKPKSRLQKFYADPDAKKHSSH